MKLSTVLRKEATYRTKRQAKQLQRLAVHMNKSARFAAFVEGVFAAQFEKDTGLKYTEPTGPFIDWLADLDWEAIAGWLKIFFSILMLFF